MEAVANGESMEGVVKFGGDDFAAAEEPGKEETEDDEVADAKAGARDEQTVFLYARKLDSAIKALLQNMDPGEQAAANEWLTQFVTKPFAWTAALSVAFPPPHYSGVGGSMEVRYFSLNILLGKIRSDWMQLGCDDALEIYQTVLEQIPSNLGNPWFISRILVLVSAAAAVAGEQAAVELVRRVIDRTPLVDGLLAYELLTAVAEEVFFHARAHSAEVVASMQETSTEVFQFLESKAQGPLNSQQETKIFTCIERWLKAGLTLSELYSTYPNLFKAMLGALGSQDDKCLEAAVSALSEYIAAVDLLPGREEAVRVTISATLAQQHLYAAAAASKGELGLQYTVLKSQSRGLVIMVTVLASSEASLVARGGNDASRLLNWLVDASSGGGGLGYEGASLSAVAWPRLAAVPISKRSECLGAERFAAATQGILLALKYPEGSLDISSFEDELLRYREGSATDALAACFENLGTALLSHILRELQQAVTPEAAEVCLFAAATLSDEIKSLAGLLVLQARASSEGEQVAARSFLSALFVWVSASPRPTEQDLSSQGSKAVLVQTTLLLVERFSEWTAIDLKSLEAGLQYTMSGLQVGKVRGNAAMALGEVCRAAARLIAATPTLLQVFSAYEVALRSPDTVEAESRLALVGGLASVASALPTTNATDALRAIASSALSTVAALAEMRAAPNINGHVLAEELRILAAVVTHGIPEGGSPALHPALPILHEIWPALDVVAGHWSGDANVATALCELWGVVASSVGIVLCTVLPSIIKSATAMYSQHLVPACLDCLSNIVLLASTISDLGEDVDEILAAALLEVSESLAGLNHIVESAKVKGGPEWNCQIGREVAPDDDQQQKAEAALCSMSTLARSFLHNKPSILLQSNAFSKILLSAIGALSRTETESALAAAKLLSEAILCLSFSEDDFKGKVVWQLPEELVPHVDEFVKQNGRQLVKEVIQSLARLQLLEALRDALADVLYGLCLRYPEETRTDMRIMLNAKDFPARKGVLKEPDKENFLSAAIKHPVQPRRRFQELINNFSQVCRGSMPAEALNGY